jgi:hypothetical protein
MNQTEGLPFKSYSNQFVANLEDADAGVRDTAKKAVVALFGYVNCLVCWSMVAADITTDTHQNTPKPTSRSSSLPSTCEKPLLPTS